MKWKAGDRVLYHPTWLGGRRKPSIDAVVISPAYSDANRVRIQYEWGGSIYRVAVMPHSLVKP